MGSLSSYGPGTHSVRRPGLLSRRALRASAVLLALAAGCASDKPDPLEKSNRKVYGVNNAVDKAVVRDVAAGYQKHVPEPVRTSVDNFFNNLGYLNVILNDHLQGNLAQGWRDTERMAINSTIGVLGLFDPATGLGRERGRNDFGITLGKWGVAQGPYLVLPLLGPSTTRDLPGLVVSHVTNPMFWLAPPWEVSASMSATSFVDQRARMQPHLDFRDRAALDPYAFTRDLYERYRTARISGAPPAEPDIYSDEYDPATAESAPTTAPSAAEYMR